VQLTRYSDYSFRVLIYLALAPERLVTIEEISRRYGISKAHLTKVVHELGLRGYVETVAGAGAGCAWRAAPRRSGWASWSARPRGAWRSSSASRREASA